ncbi:Cytochrome c oxidase subunit 3 [Jeotgalicoccus aerolatus]|uniref:Probable quinol oxidase subunit 3 n=1 Tax=Jeotgalicoccus aerolatus TaxID=709510 RepID=A0A1G8W1F7_9STAP|nr:cytochrome (ubi)quinol oxidase subunit III [Jeotgalicoccus aerolatus]MBP1951386.1 cytochrome c oxidase subunit 3 [Jeotgalicoccus aerolatus]GGD97917.1 cytochrome B oxidoreductase [Jeotgalicoccus aerolatus]CAD2076884.1 Cytochrome c oxidase subunit 3 [Jeotgalicoccus aerolatus]SDJ71937.1 cytochrome c oxidase subunit 3 [Jeotgalicoccus aerolatus]
MAEMKYNVPNEQWPEHPETATLEGKNKFVGFWTFLGGETVLFASLFATYLALKDSVPSSDHLLAADLFHLELAFVMTMLLLTSSLTSVYAIYHMRNNNFTKMQLWLAITVLLGAGFLALELYEFYEYVHIGHTFRSSAFGSSFYILIGTHGFHVIIGLIWITGLIIRNATRGLSVYTAAKVNTAALYWHFIDVVWVFIFTIVYLLGVL